MSCCGQHRSKMNSRPARENGNELSQKGKSVVLFEYLGNLSLTIRGIVSGKQYVFSEPGAIVEVDPRDRNMLLAMPSLRQHK